MSYRDEIPYIPPETIVKGDRRCKECSGQRVVYYSFRGFAECDRCDGSGYEPKTDDKKDTRKP